MIKRLLALAFFCACMCFPYIQAQSINEATVNYQLFTKLRGMPGNEEAMFDALYKSYTNYAAVVKSSPSTSPDYSLAKKGLTNVHSFLQNGAIYFVQNNNPQKALKHAQAFIDIPLMNAFAGETFTRDAYFPTMAYFTASNTYNSVAAKYQNATIFNPEERKHELNQVIKYFRVYLDTGDAKYRKSVYETLTSVCVIAENYDMALQAFDEATNNFPNDANLLKRAVYFCKDRDDDANLQKFLAKALAVSPNDKELLSFQGELYEEAFEFQKALNIYTKLREENPNSMSIAQHVAVNYYNLGVYNYNKASQADDEKSAKRFSRQSKDFFYAASVSLEEIVANDPSSIKYTQALAVAYNCMGNRAEFENVNIKLASMGAGSVADDVTPTWLSATEKQIVSPTEAILASAGSSNTPAVEIPEFMTYAKEYIEPRIQKWQAKDPYETFEEFQVRVSEESIKVKINELLKESEDVYLKTYSRHVRLHGKMYLRPYDAEDRTFLIESEYGDLVLSVPRENDEARIFAESWAGMEYRDPEFFIKDGSLAISRVTFVTPMGNSYSYDHTNKTEYSHTNVDVNTDLLLAEILAPKKEVETEVAERTTTYKPGSSDVDINIPKSNIVNDKTFAVIIANENYKHVAKVDMAVNDGVTFGEYCKQTLGLPEENVRFYKNATYAEIGDAITEIQEISNVYNGDIQVIFYYAGHGIPNESSHDAYLMPIDSRGLNTNACYSLNRLYSELGGLNANSVVVFLDACFSGSTREGEMLASARSIATKAKEETPLGNMVIFSAAKGDETAYPYKDKGHGLFTYFLLKKLQETKGNVTLSELFDYIKTNVSQKAITVNHKPQTPTVRGAEGVQETWQGLHLNGNGM